MTKKRVHETKVGRWTVRDGGTLPSRVLKDGTALITAEQQQQLELRAAITVLTEVELVDGDVLKFARKSLGLRQADFAELLGVSPETVSRWENGADPFKRTVQLAVLAVVKEFKNTGSLPRPLRKPNAKDRVLSAVSG